VCIQQTKKKRIDPHVHPEVATSGRMLKIVLVDDGRANVFAKVCKTLKRKTTDKYEGTA
jgi:hypothetical protein